jgi:hypothetical protein
MSAAPVPQDARKSSLWFEGLPQALRAAVEDYDFENSFEFQKLADLSAATQFEGLDVDSDSAIVSKSGWSAPGTVYVTLIYDPNKEAVEINDSYPVTVYFSVTDGKVTIQKIDPDVRSFYE